MKKLILLNILFALSLSSYAYSIPSHEQLAKLSFELLKSCGQKVYLVENITSHYAAQEDLCPHSGDILTRFGNWHFYKPDKNKEHWFVPGVIRLDFYARWNRLLDLHKSTTEIEERSGLTGAIIHFIQDVTNPSHVVPVYHGPGVTDKFDFYPVDVARIQSNMKGLCSRLDEVKDKSIQELLDLSAMRSFQSLHQELEYVENGEVKKGKFLDTFWSYPEQADDFFGEYGYLSNNFGVDEFKIYITKPKRLGTIRTREVTRNDKYKVKAKVYDDFAYERHLDAIIYSARIYQIK